MKLRLRFHVLLFAAVRLVYQTAYRMVYPFLAVFARGLGVDLQVISLAVTARALTAALGPFLASVADSRGRKAGMLLGAAIFLAATGLVVVLPAYPAFFISLLLVALTSSVFNPAMQAFLGDRVSYARRGLVMASTEISWSMSFIVGVPLMGVLIARFGWQAPFPALLLLGAVAFALLAWLLPGERPVEGPRSGLRANLRNVLTYGPALAGLLMSLTMTAANEIVNLVFGVWMEDSLGVQIAALGAASAVIGFSELGGEALSAAITDRLGKERSVAIGLALNCLAAILLPFAGHTLVGAFAGLFLFYLTFEFSIVCAIPLMTEVLPSARATLLATNVAAQYLGRAAGSLLSPMLYQGGMLVNTLAAVALNLLAIAALRGVKIAQGEAVATDDPDKGIRRLGD